MKEAFFYKKEKEEVICFLCNHRCRIKEEKLGICGVRKNLGGILYSLNYGKIVSTHIDPIEKKPFFHFFSSSKAYSVASVGCNFKCGFCQNWQISQVEEAKRLGIEGFEISAQAIVEEAIRNNCKSISYTYTEPTIYFEFAFQTSQLAKEKGLYNNFVTNGYMSKEALEYISPYLDAANVDLKSFREDFYRKICKASLKPVLDNIILMKKLNIWVEITTLIIPGLNDKEEELKEIARFISSLDKNIPWHISRFHPDYKFLNFSSTPLSTLKRAYEIAKEKGLKFVYIGNIYTPYGENTYCPKCDKLLIKRVSFFVEEVNITKGRCNFCQEKIAGVFEDEGG